MKKEKDPEKELRLLESAFKLFTEKGIKNTSIQEIVDSSNVAKGTFYLYFKDKYELRDVLIAKKSSKLFSDALSELRKNYINNLDDSKNLSLGIFNKSVEKIYQETTTSENNIYDLFFKGIKEQKIQLKNPEVTLYMIIELVSSSCFNSILYNDPLPINEFKPYLYDAIRRLIKS